MAWILDEESEESIHGPRGNLHIFKTIQTGLKASHWVYSLSHVEQRCQQKTQVDSNWYLDEDKTLYLVHSVTLGQICSMISRTREVRDRSLGADEVTSSCWMAHKYAVRSPVSSGPDDDTVDLGEGKKKMCMLVAVYGS